MKSQWQHFYQKFHLILDTLSWETSLFVISEVLGLFGNTLTADDMYSHFCKVFKRQYLENRKHFFNFLLHFRNLEKILHIFKKNICFIA